MKTKFVKNYRNTWTIKNPDINISKDEIRETVHEAAEIFGFGYMFGTPEDWNFEGPTIKVTIANMGASQMRDKNFQPFIEWIINRYKTISGKKVSHKCNVLDRSGMYDNGSLYAREVYIKVLTPCIIVTFK